jgi:hypothetical protein
LDHDGGDTDKREKLSLAYNRERAETRTVCEDTAFHKSKIPYTLEMVGGGRREGGRVS